MKKLSILILSLAFVAFSGIHETAKSQSPIDLGIKGGINFATYVGSDTDFDTRTEYTAGLAMEFSLPALPIGLESGIYYSHKGAERNGGSVRLSVEYIKVPLLVKYSLPIPAPVSPHIVAGPYAAYAFNASSRGVTFTNVSSLQDFTNEIDAGVSGGLGIDLNVGITKVNIQGLYSYGFTSVFEDAFDGNAKNGVFSVVAGIMF